MATYKQSIVKVVEMGAPHEFEENEYTQELKALWGEIYQ
jgi:hypothetical protein